MNNYVLNIRVVLSMICLLFSSVLYSQNAAKCDLKFVDHLVNIGDYEEALFLLDSSECLSIQSSDSVNYLRGWCLYSLKRLTESSESLSKVMSSSEFYLKSNFFAAYNYLHTGNTTKAIDCFSKIKVNTEKEFSIKRFELAGAFLLQGNIEAFEDSLSLINNKFYEISDSYDNLQKIYVDFRSHKQKSPVLAGIFSGIIPGSGKLYSGKKGEAISAFLATTGLGIVAWENYKKSGLNSFKTIAFGSLFAFSYVANIYGSVLTVNILETEYRDNVKSTILFNLHIPLRNTYDK